MKKKKKKESINDILADAITKEAFRRDWLMQCPLEFRTRELPLNHRAPTRYYSRIVNISLFEALVRFFKYGFWSWQKVTFDPVYKDDPRYDAAPYEERIITSLNPA